MRWFTAAAVATLAIIQAGSVGALPQRPPPSSGPYLNQLAQQHGKLWLGTAADIPDTIQTTDEAYLAILLNDKNFGEFTPANEMKVSGQKLFRSVAKSTDLFVVPIHRARAERL